VIDTGELFVVCGEAAGRGADVAVANRFLAHLQGGTSPGLLSVPMATTC